MCIEEPEDPFIWLAKVIDGVMLRINYQFVKLESLQFLVENHPTKPSKAQWSQSLVLRLHEGDFFGEIALLSGKPRQATVKACGKVAVLVIDRGAFTRLCGSLVNILQGSMSTYSSAEISPAEDVQGTDVVTVRGI
jgi:CRP-like cAMP-binding protein